MVMARRPIGQILKDLKIISEFDIQNAMKLQKEKGGPLGRILMEQGVINSDDLTKGLAMQSGMEFVDLLKMEISQEVVDLVESTTVDTFTVMPVHFDKESSTLTVAVSDPGDLNVIDALRFSLPKISNIKTAVASEDSIKMCIDRYYHQKGESMDSMLASMGGGGGDGVKGRENIDVSQIEKDANAAPVVKLLNMILLQAVRDRGSDIHLEPFEHEFKVRYRVDGVLYEMMPPPIQLARALISRVKVMSNLDIAETRLPQDGRIELNIGGNPVDLRVSTLPTMYGESVVMRVLDRSNVSLNLEQIGLRPEELKTIKMILEKPHGIVLVTGPTGSGKTTTLYSALNDMNTIDSKIITTEDPVEYDLEGICQCQINEDIEVTFANCLRSILRQDPDIILVGEIRDIETAQIAVEASLTGHLVLSTLHTNDAPSAVTRLLDLGLEPFLITATLESIIAQRLVRRICLNCRTPYEPTEEELYELELTRTDIEGRQFYYGTGCKKCNASGYKGRIAVFEILITTDRLRDMIMNQASTAELRTAAKEEGMRGLRDSGLLHIYDGISTIEEVVKETVASM